MLVVHCASPGPGSPYARLAAESSGPESPESTTSELVERTRAFIAAANRQDFEVMVAFYAPDAVWHS